MNKIMFVATTPFVVNAFLTSHLIALARLYRVTLCVNVNTYPLSPVLREHVKIIHVGIERKIAIFSDIKSLLQLFWIFFREAPDAVHSITPKAGLLAAIAGFLSRVPHRYHTFTGQLWVNKQGRSRAFFKAIDRLIIRLSSQVFADSPSQCRFLEDEGIAQPGEMSVLGQCSIAGVDLARFRPDATLRQQVRGKLATADDACVFLFVGRITKDKGVFDLVGAFSSVMKVNPRVELWIVGPDEDGLLPQLQEAGRRAGGRIHWLGATPHPEQYMACADVLVLPSYREGFGSVIIEAAACAIPSVAYRIDGVIDAVVEERTGLLVEVGNVDALAAAMLAISSDEPMRTKMGSQALSRVSMEFSSKAVTAEWMSFYRRTLGN